MAPTVPTASLSPRSISVSFHFIAFFFASLPLSLSASFPDSTTLTEGP
jgi:hypothetical protein